MKSKYILTFTCRQFGASAPDITQKKLECNEAVKAAALNLDTYHIGVYLIQGKREKMIYEGGDSLAALERFIGNWNENWPDGPPPHQGEERRK